MNNDNQIKHHLFLIAWEIGLIKQEDRQATYRKMMSDDYRLPPDVCEEVDKLVAHIKLNY